MDSVEYDMFGQPLAVNAGLKKALQKQDEETFSDRLSRWEYIERMVPKNACYMMPTHIALVFDETKHAFVQGAFVATILLAQSFIEHRLQSDLERRHHGKIAKQGLAKITAFLREHGTIDAFLIQKIDDLRRVRNPFTHKKPSGNSEIIEFRAAANGVNLYSLLMQDAADAIALMYEIAFRDIWRDGIISDIGVWITKGESQRLSFSPPP